MDKIMENLIKCLEIEIIHLKNKKDDLEKKISPYDDYEYDHLEIAQFKIEITELEEKIKSCQQNLQSAINTYNEYIQADGINNKSSREIQELRQVIIRMERKIDALNSKVDNLAIKIDSIEQN